MPTERLHRLMELYEKRLAPIAFIGGFVLDTITLTRTDALFDHIFLIGHLVLSGTGILLLNAFEAGRLKGVFERMAWLYPFAIQFSFGALFSGSVVLYTRSGSFAGSWLFLGGLGALMIGNEFFRERYRHVVFHVSIYFVVVSSYSLIAVSTLLRTIGPGTFLISGLASLATIALFVLLLNFVVTNRIRENYRAIFVSIGLIWAVFNVLYFTNIIPPIPLALRELDLAHSIERTASGNFRISYEPAPWYRPFQQADTTFHWHKGNTVFMYSAIFAPTKITTSISHHWLYFDPASHAWVEKSVIPFTILGGRAEGYRGYSLKQGITPGRWRIEVRTERGQLLGRITFEIVETDNPPRLETREH